MFPFVFLWGVMTVSAQISPVAAALPSIVIVEQGGALCAGVLVQLDESSVQVLTAYHCVAGGGRPKITTHDEQTVVGRVERVSVRKDLALISVEGLEEPHTLLLATSPPAIGTEVWAMGHPMAAEAPAGFLAGTLRFSASHGIVSAVGERSLQTSAPINPGNSGGALIDEHMRVVGIVSRRMVGDGLGFASRVDEIADWTVQAHRMSWFGGTLGCSLGVDSYAGPAGQLSTGIRTSLSVRDRVVLSAEYYVPLEAKWSAFQRGEVAWKDASVRGELRQRLFRGPWSTHLGAFGGVAELTRRSFTSSGTSSGTFSDQRTLHPIVGAAVAFRGIGVDVAWLHEDEDWNLLVGVSIQWPGVVAVF